MSLRRSANELVLSLFIKRQCRLAGLTLATHPHCISEKMPALTTLELKLEEISCITFKLFQLLLNLYFHTNLIGID